MFKEKAKNKLVEGWIEQQGYTIASQRVEKLAQILMHFNPLFEHGDFTQLRSLDIGCGGQGQSDIASEHRFDGAQLWEPWFNRVLWLINAQTRDGIDVVEQPEVDKDNQIYSHKVFDLYNGFAGKLPIQDAIETYPGQYNLINCTNVVHLENPSPYLMNLIEKLGLIGNLEYIIAGLVEYIKRFAEYALEENGLLAIDDMYYIKQGGRLLRLKI